MQDMQDMIDRLNQSGKRLSKGHRKIAQYIVEHYDKAVFMTASRLGESVGVSESTVVRFAAGACQPSLDGESALRDGDGA